MEKRGNILDKSIDICKYNKWRDSRIYLCFHFWYFYLDRQTPDSFDIWFFLILETTTTLSGLTRCSYNTPQLSPWVCFPILLWQDVMSVMLVKPIVFDLVEVFFDLKISWFIWINVFLLQFKIQGLLLCFYRQFHFISWTTFISIL